MLRFQFHATSDSRSKTSVFPDQPPIQRNRQQAYCTWYSGCAPGRTNQELQFDSEHGQETIQNAKNSGI